MQKDYINGFVTVAIGTFVLLYAETFSSGGFSVAENAAIYPQLLAGVIIFLGALLLLQTYRAQKLPMGVTTPSDATIVPEGRPRAIKIAVALIGYVVITWLIGFVAATLIFCYIAPLILGTSKKTAVIVSLSLTVFIYLLFFMFFQVPIPYGIFFE